MNSALETIALFLKTAALGLTATALFVLFFFPAALGKHFERVQDGLEETNHSIEYAFFGVKLSHDGEAKDDLVILQEELEELRPLVACLSDGGLDCSSSQEEQVVQVKEEVAAAQDIELGRDGKVPLSGAWVVLAGSASSLSEAKEDLGRLENYRTRDIVFASNRYRILVAFHTREEANTARAAINEDVGRDVSYVRLLETWCQGYTRQPLYLSCTRPEIN